MSHISRDKRKTVLTALFLANTVKTVSLLTLCLKDHHIEHLFTARHQLRYSTSTFHLQECFKSDSFRALLTPYTMTPRLHQHLNRCISNR